MTAINEIGHRHQLPASGLKPASEARPLAIRLLVPPAVASLPATQFLASCLVNLLSRQVGSVRHVMIDCSPVSTCILLPHGAGTDDFATDLIALGAWATAGAIPVSTWRAGDAVDLTLALQESTGHTDGAELVAAGAGWRGWVGEAERATTIDVHDASPVGPFMAAALAAGEIFKRSRGITRGRLFEGLGVSLWSSQSAANWNELCDGPPLDQVTFPTALLVGAGAVGQALAYVLASASTAAAALVAIDNDKHDTSNLNRCFLAGASDLTHPKIDVLKRNDGDRFSVTTFNGDWNGFVRGPRPGLDPEIDDQVDAGDFDLVLSCVDRGTSRHQIQSVWPSNILAGRTTNLVAFADVYRSKRGEACLACHNPSERDGERIQSLRFRLRDMSPAERRVFLEQNGVSTEAIEAELTKPTCGSVGEAHINDLALRRAPEFSAGFVSLAAGLMLFSQLSKFAIGPAEVMPGMTSFSFLNGRMDQAELAPDEACELKCGERLRR